MGFCGSEMSMMWRGRFASWGDKRHEVWFSRQFWSQDLARSDMFAIDVVSRSDFGDKRENASLYVSASKNLDSWPLRYFENASQMIWPCSSPKNAVARSPWDKTIELSRCATIE